MTAVPAILRYLMEKTAAAEAAAGAPDGATAAGVRGVPLTADAARAFLKVLQASAQGLPVELLRELQVGSWRWKPRSVYDRDLGMDQNSTSRACSVAWAYGEQACPLPALTSWLPV